MWSGDISPLVAHRRQAALYRRAAMACRACGDEAAARELESMASGEDSQGDQWDFNRPSLRGWPDVVESLQ